MQRYNFVIVVLLVGIAIFLIINFIPSRYFSADPEGITKLYYADNISPAQQEIIEVFNTRHQGSIEVVPIHLPFHRFTTNKRKELLARSLRSRNSRIDIFSVDVIWVPRFARWAMPLAEFLPADEMEQILDEAIFTAYYKGELVSVPFYIDVGLMYYRQDIIRSLPDGESLERKLKDSITWKEFLALREKFANKKALYVFQGDHYEGIVCQFIEVIAGNGEGVVQNGELSLNTEPAIQSVQHMVDLIHRHGVVPRQVTTFNEDESYRYALAHDIPFFRGWPGLDQDIGQFGSDSGKIQLLGIAPLPHFEGHKPAGAFGGWNLMVSRHTSKREAAMKFIRFALSPQSQEILIRKGHYYPVNRMFYQDDRYVEQYPELQYYRYLLHLGVHRPWLENYTEVSEVLSFYLNRALKREIPPEQALREAEQMIGTGQVFIR